MHESSAHTKKMGNEDNDSSKETDDETEENGVISRTASMEGTKVKQPKINL